MKSRHCLTIAGAALSTLLLAPAHSGARGEVLNPWDVVAQTHAEERARAASIRAEARDQVDNATRRDRRKAAAKVAKLQKAARARMNEREREAAFDRSFAEISARFQPDYGPGGPFQEGYDPGSRRGYYGAGYGTGYGSGRGSATQEPPPVAERVASRPGIVISPYAPGRGYVDVRGIAPGTEVRDPYTGRSFVVP